MYVELAKLLAERPICHPATLDAVHWSAQGFRLTISGYPWWRGSSPGQDARGSIHFVFREIGDGKLSPQSFDFSDDEILEDFDILPVAEVGWAQQHAWAIFCLGPVPDPPKLYGQLNDFLSAEGSFKGPDNFLNQGHAISAFTLLTQSRGFQLGGGPDCVRALLCDELDAQGVSYNAIRAPERPAEHRLLVKFAGSAFICSEALAELDPPMDSGFRRNDKQDQGLA